MDSPCPAVHQSLWTGDNTLSRSLPLHPHCNTQDCPLLGKPWLQQDKLDYNSWIHTRYIIFFIYLHICSLFFIHRIAIWHHPLTASIDLQNRRELNLAVYKSQSSLPTLCSHFVTLDPHIPLSASKGGGHWGDLGRQIWYYPLRRVVKYKA